MPKESLESLRSRAQKVEERLLAHYGEGFCSLYYTTPFTLAIAVVLSAQCSDAAVNKVTPLLFEAYGTPEKLASAEIHAIETIIHPLGFYRVKARKLVALAQMLVSDFAGEIPNDIDDLQKLPGVGRKTANVVMCEAFNNAQGIAVDTHVFRIAHRLNFASKSDDTPDKTEAKLLKIYPKDDWHRINRQWVHFGREFCKARNPKCTECPINDFCPK